MDAFDKNSRQPLPSCLSDSKFITKSLMHCYHPSMFIFFLYLRELIILKRSQSPLSITTYIMSSSSNKKFS